MLSSIGNKEIFAQNLNRYLNRFGVDQKIVAESVGVAPSTFNEWTKGKKYPRIDKIEMLAQYFGILKSDLIEEYNESNSPTEPKLSEGEQKVIDLFRQVPEDKQQLVLQMIETALRNL